MKLLPQICKTSTPCGCMNQYLLKPGSLCDICMGTVQKREDQPVQGGPFGKDYFEALEAELEQRDDDEWEYEAAQRETDPQYRTA